MTAGPSAQDEPAGNRRIGGIHAVETAISGGSARVRLIRADHRRRDRRLQRLLTQADRHGIPVERVSTEELEAWLGDVRHQGVAAEVVGSGILDEAALRDRVAGLAHPPFLLALDNVQDPHNLGACLRSAEAAGVDAVIIPRDRAARLTPAVERAAAGAAELVPIAAVTNLARTLTGLQADGCWVVGAAGDAPTELYAADLDGPLVLVCGGEADGLRKLTRATCDTLVSIPLAGRVQSLNVSVAAGICLFEALRQRRGGPRGRRRSSDGSGGTTRTTG